MDIPPYKFTSIAACFEEAAAICTNHAAFCRSLIDTAKNEAAKAKKKCKTARKKSSAQAGLSSQVVPEENMLVVPEPTPPTGSRPSRQAALVARQIFSGSFDLRPSSELSKKHANAGSSKLPATSNEAPPAPDDSYFLKPAVPAKKIKRAKKAGKQQPGTYLGTSVPDASLDSCNKSVRSSKRLRLNDTHTLDAIVENDSEENTGVEEGVASGTVTLGNSELKTEVASDKMEVYVPRTRTKTLQKKEKEDTVKDDVVESGAMNHTKILENSKLQTEGFPDEPMEVDAPRTRTKTIRKKEKEPPVNEVSTVAPEAMDQTKILGNSESQTEVSPVESKEADVPRTRTKTIQKMEKKSSGLKVSDERVVSDKHPTMENEETHNDANQKDNLGSSEIQQKAKSNVGGKFGIDLVGGADTIKSSDVQQSAESQEPTVNETASGEVQENKTFQVTDPMDTWEIPGGVDVEHLDLGVDQMQQQLYLSAPRTRSKMRVPEELRAKSADRAREPPKGKENSGAAPLNFILGNGAVNNKSTNSPSVKSCGPPSRLKNAGAGSNLANVKKREDEALKKKQELIELKKQEVRKQREIKMKKVNESKAAAEKDKRLQLEKEKNEREEKDNQAKAELMRKNEEALQKKKLLHQQKLQEALDRRRREEQARLAKLREQEEEQRRAAEAKQKQVKVYERLAAIRKQVQKEEERTRELSKLKEKSKLVKTMSETFNPVDFGIDDNDGDDSSMRRRPQPKWAEKDESNRKLEIQIYVEPGVVRSFFNPDVGSPNLREIFGQHAVIRPRTSSAVWPSPPPPPPMNS